MPGVSRDVLIRVLSETGGATRAEKALKAFEDREKKAAKAAEALNKNLEKTTKLSKQVVGHQDELHRVFGRLTPTVERLSMAYGRLADKLGAVKMGMAGLAGAGTAAYGMRVANLGMQFQASLDQSLARLTAEIRKDNESWDKSRERAEQLIKWGIQYKIQTPYALDQIMETLSGMAILYRGDIEKAKRATEVAALLASKNPRQGLMGAFIALQEAESGYMMSPMRRFNLPKNVLMKYYKKTGSGLEAIDLTLKELKVNQDLMFKVTETLPGLEHQIQNLYRLVYGELMEGIFKARREHLRFVRDRMKEMLNEKSTAHKLIQMTSDLMGRVASIYYKLLEAPVRFADNWLPIIRNFSRALDPLIANITAFGKGIWQGFVLPFKAFLGTLSVAGKIMRPFMGFFSAFGGTLGKIMGSPAYAGVPIARVAGTAVGLWLSAKMTGRAVGYMRGRRGRTALGYGTPEEIREAYYSMGVEHPPELSRAEITRLKKAVREAKRRARRRAEESGMSPDMAEIYVEQAGEEAHARWLRKRLMKGGKGPGYPTAETFAEIQQRKMVSEFARAVIEFKHSVELMTRAVILAHSGQTGAMQRELAPFALANAPGGRFAGLRRRFAKTMMTAAMVQNYRHWFESGPLFDTLKWISEATGIGGGVLGAYEGAIKGRSIFQNIALAGGALLSKVTGGKGFWGEKVAGGLLSFGLRPHKLQAERFVLAGIDRNAVDAMTIAFARAIGRKAPSGSGYETAANAAQGVKEIADAFDFRRVGKAFSGGVEKVKKAAQTMEGPARKVFDGIAGGMTMVGGAFEWAGATKTLMRRGAKTGGLGGAWQALKGRIASTTLWDRVASSGVAAGGLLGSISSTLWGAGTTAAGLLGGLPAWALMAGAGGLGWLMMRRKAGQNRRLALAYAQQGDMMGAMRAMAGTTIAGGIGTAMLGTGLVAAGGQYLGQKYLGMGIVTMARTAFPMLFPLILSGMAVSTITTLTKRVMDRVGILFKGGAPSVFYDKPVAIGQKIGGWIGKLLGWGVGGAAGGIGGGGLGWLAGSLITNDPRIRLAIALLGAGYGAYKGGGAAGNWLGGVGSGAGGFGAGTMMSLLASGGMAMLGKRFLFPGGGIRGFLARALVGSTVAPWLGGQLMGEDSLAANPLFNIAAMFLPELFWRAGTGPAKMVGRWAAPWLAKGWMAARGSPLVGRGLKMAGGVLRGGAGWLSRTWFGKNLITGTKMWFDKVPFLRRVGGPISEKAVETATKFSTKMISMADEAAAALAKGGAATKISSLERILPFLLKVGKVGFWGALITGVVGAGYGIYRWLSGRRRGSKDDEAVMYAGTGGPGSSGGSGGLKPWIYATLAQVLPVAMTMMPINPVLRNVLGVGAGLGFGALSLNERGGSTAFATMQIAAIALAMARGGAMKTLLSPRRLVRELGVGKAIKVWFDALLKGILGPDIWGFLKRSFGRFFARVLGKAEVASTAAMATRFASFAGAATAAGGGGLLAGASKWFSRFVSAPMQIALAPFLGRAGLEDEGNAAVQAALRTVPGYSNVQKWNPTTDGGMSLFLKAIRSQESAGLGGYKAKGAWVKGDRAYGAYQVMGNNIAPWLKRYAGIDLPKDQAIKLFMENPQLQDYIVGAVMSERANKLMSGQYGWTPKNNSELYRSLAAGWYGNPNKWLKVHPDNLPTNEIKIGDTTYPSLAGYANSVLGRMEKEAAAINVTYNINGPVDADSLKKVLDEHTNNLKHQIRAALIELAD